MTFWNRFFGSTASTAAGYGIGSALGPALSPITQEVANEVWSRYTVRPLSVGQAAQLAAREFWTEAEADAEAAWTGYSPERTNAMRLLATQPPSTGELLTARNRDVIGEAELIDGLAQAGYPAKWRDVLRPLRFVLAPVTDLVRFAVREVFNPAQRAFLDLDAEFPEPFATEAARIGMRRELAADYWAAHWELPSYTQAVEMLHRRQITQAQFSDLLKALDFAPTWRPKLEAIARPIPPLDDMIRFAVREVYDPALRAELGLDANYPAEFTSEAALHGMDEARARQYWAAHWRLPSAQQGYQMLWRTDLGEAGLKTLLRALDYPEKWRDRLMQIAYHPPGRVDLRRMFAAKVIDRSEVKEGYRRLGYQEADAEQLTRLAEALAGGSEDGYLPRAESQLWTTTHRSFVNHEADNAAVTSRLTMLGIPAADQTKILTLWTAERSLTRRTLTPTQIRKAYTKGVVNPATDLPWTRDEALDALQDLGYSAADAETFVAEA